MENKTIALGIAATSIVVSGGFTFYLRQLKGKLRGYVLRYEKIRKYFEDEIE